MERIKLILMMAIFQHIINMNNFSFPNNFNNNTIAQPKKTQKTRPSRIARIDFNHPILNQQFNRYPFS